MSRQPKLRGHRRGRRWSLHVARLLLFAATATLALAIGLTLWLLASESGLRNGLALARQLSGGALSVDAAEGRLIGPLRLEGLRFAAAGTVVEIGQLDLEADWTRALQLDFTIARLHLDGVQVQLPPAPDEPVAEAQAAQGQPDLRLPVGIFVQDLQLDDLQIVDAAGEEVLALQHAGFAGHWNRADIRVERLRLVHRDYGELSARAEATALAEGLHIASLQLAGPGTLHAEGRVGLSAQADNHLQLSWQDLHWPPQGEPAIRSEQGRLRLDGSWTALRFDAEARVNPQARLQASGQWSPDRIEAQLSWTGLIDFTRPQSPLWRSERGRLDISGLPEDYRFELHGELEARDLPGRILASGQGDLQHLVLDRFLLEVLGGSLRGEGRLAWAPALRAELTLAAERLDPSALFVAWPGSIDGTAAVEFAMRQQQPDASFRVDIADSRLRERAVSLNLRGRYRGEALMLQTLELRSGRSRLSASGRATPPFDLQLALDSPDLEALWPAMQGRARLQAQLGGSLPVPQLRLQGELHQAAWLDYRIAQARIDAEIHPRQPMSVQIEAQGLELGETIEAASLQLQGALSDHRLQLALDDPRGTVALALSGGYAPAAQRWDGQLQSLQLSPSGAGTWALDRPVPLSLSPELAEIGRACLGGAGGRGCFTARYTPQQTGASLDLERFALDYLQPLLPEEYAARGEISGRAELSLSEGALARASVDLSTGELRLRAGATTLRLAPSTLALRENENGLNAEATLKLGEGAVRLQAQAEPGEGLADRALSGHLGIDLPDLAVLQRMSPEIGEAQGSLHGAFTLGGSLGLPTADGRLAVEEGSIRLETPGILLTDLQARVSGSSAGEIRVALSAMSGKGTIDVAGSVDFAAKPLSADFRVRGDRFQAANTPVAKVWIDPDLEIRLDAAGLDISGEVGVPQALITPERFQSSGAVSPSSDQVIVAGDGSEPEPALPIRAEVTVRLGDKLRFEGYGLSSRLQGALTVIEQPGRLTSARGQISMAEGKYEAYGQELSIETGRLIYSGQPLVDPTLQLRAYRQPRENITVGVVVRGSLEQPQFNLYSTPSMTQQEQLSWLVLGRPLAAGAGDDAALANAALSLGLKGGQWFAEKVGGGIGLDEVSVGAEPGETADQAQLTIGKYLSPKLYVSYGVSLFQPGRTIKLRYDLGGGFAVETESGVHSGGDLLYSVEK